MGKLVNLKWLILFENALEGRVPDELGACVELEELNLRSNKLSGAIPPSIGKLVKLKTLHLFENALEGRVPDELGACVRSRICGSSTAPATGSSAATSHGRCAMR